MSDKLKTVISYITDEKQIHTTRKKLNHLIYYSYVEHLIENKLQLFTEDILVGLHGPIIQTVNDTFKNNITITKSNLNHTVELTEDEKESIVSALEICKEDNGNQLEVLTVHSDPYIEAKKNGTKILDEYIYEYYND